MSILVKLVDCSSGAELWALGHTLDELTVGIPELSVPPKGKSAERKEDYPVTVAALREMLKYIHPNCGRNTWLAIGAAIHYEESRGFVTLPDMVMPDPDFDGLELFDEWSSGQLGDVEPGINGEGSPVYSGYNDCEKNWNRFRTDHPNPSKIGTIVQHARANSYGGPTDKTYEQVYGTYTSREQETNETKQDRATGSGAKPGGFDITSAEEVVPKQVNWVWQGRLARGKLTILAGAPGQGKSQISFYIASQISNGGLWIDGGKAPKGRILVLSSEDGIEDTMVPQLIAAGADKSQIYFLRATIDPTTSSRRRAFSLQTDLDALGRLVVFYQNVVLIIVDPITSYMGDKIDSHQTTQVRSVLDPVSDWAERHKVAVLGISHPPKASQGSAINSVTGSLAFVGVARLVFCAIKDPTWSGYSLLLAIKNNLGPNAKGLRYRIESHEIDAEGGKIGTSLVGWNTTSEVTVTADEALAAERATKRDPSKVEQAKEFLREQLQEGAKPVKFLQVAARNVKFCWRTVETAKAQLRIVPRKDGLNGPWIWELPVSANQSEGGQGF